MTFLRRLLLEKRKLVLPLAVALAITAAIYVAVVYPLSTRVAAAEERATQARLAIRQAEQAFANARATQEGKRRADEELARFYRDVLPANLSGARRITYARLTQIAQQANLRYERQSVDESNERGSTLTRLTTKMVLQGEYRDVRRFIHQLDTAPEFVVIDDVTLVQGSEGRSALVLTVTLSTYYRTDDGS